MTAADALTCEGALVSAVGFAPWLDPDGIDAAAITEARLVARQLDALLAPAARPGADTLFPTGGGADTAAGAGKVGFLSNSLLAILAQLGLTPQGRAQLGIESGGDDGSDLLGQLRAITARDQTADG